jgi:hypothetical protein
MSQDPLVVALKERMRLLDGVRYFLNTMVEVLEDLEGEVRGPDLATAHSARFRKVANRYPLRVTNAYGGDLAAVAQDTDAQVAARVAAWEREQGMEPRDWVAIGREERDGPADATDG